MTVGGTNERDKKGRKGKEKMKVQKYKGKE
jgi:hypothetical protein